MRVVVRNNDINQALKVLKRKLQQEGIIRELKQRAHYEKPSEKRVRESREAVRRAFKAEKKRIERDGF